MTAANQQPVLDEVRRCLTELADGTGEEEFRRAKVQVKASFILGLETVARRRPISAAANDGKPCPVGR